MMRTKTVSPAVFIIVAGSAAAITAEPVGEVLQRLEDVVANLFRVIVGDHVGDFNIGS